MLEARKKKKKISLSKVKFTDDYRWDLAFEAIKELTGVSPNAIRRSSRVTPLPAARMMLAYLMYKELGMTPAYIGHQLNKDRSATYYEIQALEEYKQTDPYKSYYEAFNELFYKKLKDLGYCCHCCGALEPVMKGDRPLKPNKDVT
jgi:hypothetical protein